MIGLDTNILARYYIEDTADKEAQRQRIASKKLIESGRPLMVCKTVILELEWVMRGYYGFSNDQALSVLRHLINLPHVVIEDRATIERALSHGEVGIDLADALHHASYRSCESVATFDDKKLARRAKKLGLTPGIVVPT
ncbi:putative nucleic-acid-binding protein [Oxalobacteraceae bacterium GrIS 2.11]